MYQQLHPGRFWNMGKDAEEMKKGQSGRPLWSRKKGLRAATQGVGV
jgi:hypothetical protein